MKRFLLISAVVVFTILVVVAVLFSQKKPIVQLPIFPTPTPVKPAAGAVDYSLVFPDASVAKQVTDLFQNPIAASQEAGFDTVSFATDVSGRPNKVYEKNGVAQFVVQEVTTDNNYLTTFLTQHPNSQSFALFDSSSAGSGFSWQVFPQEGTAFLANANAGYALKILYFPPTTQKNFLNAAAKTFNMLQTDPYASGETFQ